METKINIEISLSKNYNKISLGLLDEAVSHESEEEFKAEVKKKFSLLKKLVLDEFEEKPQTKAEDSPTQPQMASDKQKAFLKTLGYKDSVEGLSMDKASEYIKNLKGNY